MSLSLGNWRNSQEEILTETTELPLIGDLLQSVGPEIRQVEQS